MRKSALLVAIMLVATQASVLTLPVEAQDEASLSMGSATLRNGCPGSIPINLNTGGEAIWAADVGLSVSGGATVDSLVLGSVLPMQACNDAEMPDLILCGARQAGSGAFTGTGVYGTINVTPSGTGTLSFDFDDETSKVINEDIEDVLGDAIGGDYTVRERFNVEVDGTGFCTPDTTAPTITVSPSNGQNNVSTDTSVTLSLSDNRVGVDPDSISFKVGGVQVDTFSYTASGGSYKPATPFNEGEKVMVQARACDLVGNCRDYAGSFRVTPPEPPASCGDGTVDEGEECDAGRQTAACDRDCTFVECGDGIINDVAGEQCDDLNSENGDGCSSTCAIEVPVEDKLYCDNYTSAAAVCPLTDERPVADEQTPETEVEAETPTNKFKEEDFAQSATSSVSEAALRPSAKTVILPATSEQQQQIDPCILQYGTAGATLDHDGDGLSDRTECYSGTDPDSQDTDGDTCLDGEEINRFYTDPLVADCSISDYVEEEILIIDPKPNWILTSLEISGSTPRQSQTVGVTAFPALQKTYSKVLSHYKTFLEVLKRDVDPANAVAAQQKLTDLTDTITKLQTAITDTQTFLSENSDMHPEVAAELERVTSFLDSGAVGVAGEIKQAESLYAALEKHRTKTIFLGEVDELQVVGVGNTTTAGFNLQPKKQLEDGLYDLVATAGFADGGTKSSAPVRIQISSSVEVGTPIPQSLDGKPIGAEELVIQNSRPVLSGQSVYGAMVFATWESLVLESSIIADSAEGNFDVQPPRELEPGVPHKVTMYAVTEVDGRLIRSKNTTVDFTVEAMEEPGRSIYYYAIGIALFLLLVGAANYALSRHIRRKKETKQPEEPKVST